MLICTHAINSVEVLLPSFSQAWQHNFPSKDLMDPHEGAEGPVPTPLYLC